MVTKGGCGEDKQTKGDANEHRTSKSHEREFGAGGGELSLEREYLCVRPSVFGGGGGGERAGVIDVHSKSQAGCREKKRISFQK